MAKSLLIWLTTGKLASLAGTIATAEIICPVTHWPVTYFFTDSKKLYPDIPDWRTLYSFLIFLDNQVADALASSHYEIRVEDGKLFYDRRWLVSLVHFKREKGNCFDHIKMFIFISQTKCGSKQYGNISLKNQFSEKNVWENLIDR